MAAIEADVDACQQDIKDILASLTRIEDHLKAMNADMRARLEAWRNRESP